MSFPRYPEYKDSGVEWIGTVPAHWRVAPIRTLARSEPRAFTDGDWIETPYITDAGVRLLQTGNVGVGVYREQGFRYVSDSTFTELDCTEVSPGDVMICRLADPVGRACVAPNLGDRMITSVDVCILKPRPEVDARFLVYVFSSAQYLGFMEGQCRGGTRDRVSRSFLASVQVALAPTTEQHAIADFLDHETAKVDALVAEQQRLIELLKEKRHAVISHAVTKGLDPDAPMKDSGIEWLGQIPAHWTITKMKWAAKMDSGHTPDKKIGAYWEGGDIPWVSLNDTAYLKDNDYISETAHCITPAGIENSSAHLLPAGAVVFSRDATIGRCAITSRPMAVSQHFIAWICGERLLAAYLLLRLRSMAFELELLTTGATVKTIGMPEVRTLITPLPPIAEQRAIVKHVSEQRAALQALEDDAARAVTLLQERRTALVSAAVTGQIDVRSTASAPA